MERNECDGFRCWDGDALRMLEELEALGSNACTGTRLLGRLFCVIVYAEYLTRLIKALDQPHLLALV